MHFFKKKFVFNCENLRINREKANKGCEHMVRNLFRDLLRCFYQSE